VGRDARSFLLRVGVVAVGPGSLVIYTPDPLLFGGELLVLEVTTTALGVVLLCEQVNHEPESEGEPPPRGLFNPHDLEDAQRWARQPA
jgi:hypothetical protein